MEMEFLNIIKKNYEENEHLHLLVKFNHFVMGLIINEESFLLTYINNQCFITKLTIDNQIPTIYLNNETIKDILLKDDKKLLKDFKEEIIVC